MVVNCISIKKLKPTFQKAGKEAIVQLRKPVRKFTILLGSEFLYFVDSTIQTLPNIPNGKNMRSLRQVHKISGDTSGRSDDTKFPRTYL